MRLLDHVAQCTVPFLAQQTCGDVWRLTSAGDFSQAIVNCPLRLVLTDDLVRVCIELAYSKGDELCGCLDLVHLPAERLWVEWSEAARHNALRCVIPECVPTNAVNVARGGVLICSERSGRAGSLRTFFLTDDEPREPLVAAIETALDLDGPGEPQQAESTLRGGVVRACDPQNEHLDAVLRCARFRLDPVWQRYYGRALVNSELGEQVMRLLISSVLFDIPMLLALFLLMAIRADLVQRAVKPERLNRKRVHLRRPPLLEHVEVSTPLLVQAGYRNAQRSPSARNAPRFHHVRGHIVRRDDTVFWRGPHWRGHLRLGRVRSRTAELRLQ